MQIWDMIVNALGQLLLTQNDLGPERNLSEKLDFQMSTDVLFKISETFKMVSEN